MKSWTNYCFPSTCFERKAKDVNVTSVVFRFRLVCVCCFVLLTRCDHPTPENSVLFCFINPRVRKIRNEASSCPGVFSRTLRFCPGFLPGRTRFHFHYTHLSPLVSRVPVGMHRTVPGASRYASHRDWCALIHLIHKMKMRLSKS